MSGALAWQVKIRSSIKKYVFVVWRGDRTGDSNFFSRVLLSCVRCLALASTHLSCFILLYPLRNKSSSLEFVIKISYQRSRTAWSRGRYLTYLRDNLLAPAASDIHSCWLKKFEARS